MKRNVFYSNITENKMIIHVTNQANFLHSIKTESAAYKNVVVSLVYLLVTGCT